MSWSRIQISLEVLALSAVIFALSIQGPWWILVLPVFGYGILKGQNQRALLIGFGAAVLAWIASAFLEDLASGFRISKRIAGVGHLRWGIFAYLLIGLLVGLLGLLAASTGASLRAILESRGWVRRHRASGDARAD